MEESEGGGENWISHKSIEKGGFFSFGFLKLLYYVHLLILNAVVIPTLSFGPWGKRILVYRAGNLQLSISPPGSAKERTGFKPGQIMMIFIVMD